MNEERCGYITQRACCPCEWLAHTRSDDGLVRRGDQSWCACSGMEPHNYREEVTCERRSVPPLVPTWDHERWTGHAFVAPEGAGDVVQGGLL
jgi:hypothetical protein